MRAKLSNFYIALAIDFENVSEVLDEIVLFIQNIRFHRGVHFENYSKNCGKIHRKTITPKSFANKFDKAHNFIKKEL